MPTLFPSRILPLPLSFQNWLLRFHITTSPRFISSAFFTSPLDASPDSSFFRLPARNRYVFPLPPERTFAPGPPLPALAFARSSRPSLVKGKNLTLPPRGFRFAVLDVAFWCFSVPQPRQPDLEFPTFHLERAFFSRATPKRSSTLLPSFPLLAPGYRRKRPRTGAVYFVERWPDFFQSSPLAFFSTLPPDPARHRRSDRHLLLHGTSTGSGFSAPPPSSISLPSPSIARCIFQRNRIFPPPPLPTTPRNCS